MAPPQPPTAIKHSSHGPCGRYPLGADPEASWRDLDGLYLPAADAGALPLRVRAYLPLRSWRRLVRPGRAACACVHACGGCVRATAACVGAWWGLVGLGEAWGGRGGF